MAAENNEASNEEPRFTDKRRIDPETGEVRGETASEGASVSADAPEGPAVSIDGEELSPEDAALLDETRASMTEEVDAAKAEAAEHKDALARLQADYVNYRNRVARERAGDRDATVASVIEQLLPVLDDLDLARKHGDLEEGPLALIAQKLETTFGDLDVSRVGEVGEVFDPSKHEAIAQLPNAEAKEETVADVVQVGYRVGERLLRAAKVAVQVPAS